MNAMTPIASSSSSTISTVLRAEQVGASFGSGKQYVEAIRDVSFELRQGETLAIVGPSGCGKSTLFNVIAGLLKPTRGHVEVAGIRVDDAAGHVGYMLQKDLLLPWRSVIDNVMLGLEVRGAPRQTSRDIAMKLMRLRPGRFRERQARNLVRRHAPARGHHAHAGIRSAGDPAG